MVWKTSTEITVNVLIALGVIMTTWFTVSLIGTEDSLTILDTGLYTYESGWVYQGQEMDYGINYCKKDNVDLYAEVHLKPLELKIPLETIYVGQYNLPVNCRIFASNNNTISTKRLTIPETITPGQYEVLLTITYRTGPFDSLRLVHLRSTTLEVKPSNPE